MPGRSAQTASPLSAIEKMVSGFAAIEKILAATPLAVVAAAPLFAVPVLLLLFLLPLLVLLPLLLIFLLESAIEKMVVGRSG